MLSPSLYKYSLSTRDHLYPPHPGEMWWRSRMEAQWKVDQRQCRNLEQMSHILLLQGKNTGLSEIDMRMNEDLRNEKIWYLERIIVARIFITLLDLWSTLQTVTWDAVRFSWAAIEDRRQNLTPCLRDVLNHRCTSKGPWLLLPSAHYQIPKGT